RARGGRRLAQRHGGAPRARDPAPDPQLRARHHPVEPRRLRARLVPRHAAVGLRLRQFRRLGPLRARRRAGLDLAAGLGGGIARALLPAAQADAALDQAMTDAPPASAPGVEVDGAEEPSTVAAVLNRIVEDQAGERVAIGDIIGSLGPRAHGFALLLLSAPNLTPGPSMPGFSTIFALPMCLVAAQMVLGQRSLWLPHFLMRRSMKRGFFIKLVNALVTLVARLDRVLRPRWPALTTPFVERLLGLAGLGFAVLLLLPLPFYSLLPATGAIMLSLGI